MNKKYLEELYRIKFELQAKIEKSKEDFEQLSRCEVACDHDARNSAKSDKKAYECAEKHIDAAINFYISMHS